MAKTGCPGLSGAWSATRIFCLPDGRDLVHTIDEAEDMVLSAASVQLDVSGGR
jgi:death-on-curing protein